MTDNPPYRGVDHLMPHQAQLADDIAKRQSGHLAVLAPVGAGMASAISAGLAKKYLGRSEASSTLIIVSQLLLLEQWKGALERWGLDASVVDFVAYRSLEAKTPAGSNPWEFTDAVVIAPINLIGGERLLSHLTAAAWNTVVVNAPGHLSPRSPQVEAMREMMDSDSTLFIAYSSTRQPLDVLGFDEAHTIRISPSRPKRTVSAITHSPTETESVIVEEVSNLKLPEPIQGILRRRAESSLYSLELSLRRARNNAAHHIGGDEAIPPHQLGEVQTILDSLSNLEEDTKWRAVLALSEELKAKGANLAVITDFEDTAAYLSYRFQDEGLKVALVSGAMANHERGHAVQLLIEERAILIQTAAAGPIEVADHVIHYDLPESTLEIEERIDSAEVMNHSQSVSHFVIEAIGTEQENVRSFFELAEQR